MATRVKYNSGARENQKIEILNFKSSIEKKRQKEANQQKKDRIATFIH